MIVNAQLSAENTANGKLGSAPEKDELARVIDILDQAMVSEDPRVRDCLERLMVATALMRPENRVRKTGPLSDLRDNLNNVTLRLAALEMQVQRMAMQQPPGQQFPWVTPPTIVGPTVVTTSSGTSEVLPWTTTTTTTMVP